MSTHTLGIVAGVIYVASLVASLVTPVPEKRPWTFERVCHVLIRLALNVFTVWLIVTVVF